MEFLGSRLGDHLDIRASGFSILRTVVRRGNTKLRYGVNARIEHERIAAATLVHVIGTVDLPVIEISGNAIEGNRGVCEDADGGRIKPRAQGSGARDEGGQVGEVSRFEV